jgi:hypothetical protein
VHRRLRHAITVVAGLSLAGSGFVAGSTVAAAAPAAAPTPGVTAAAVAVPTPTVTRPPDTPIGPIALQADLTQMPQYGYVQDEVLFGGTARSYVPVGPIGSDGQWSVAKSSTMPYETRMLIRRPSDPAKFNGTVVVEWLNVTAGFDTSPDWQYARVELMRQGYIWVGVSAQSVGINSVPLGLKNLDPVRYASLVHPGDDYSYDIYSQTSRAIVAPRGVNAFAGYRIRYLIADGESQSASRMTTYVNAISPRDHAYDAYLIHSRSASAPKINSATAAPMPNPTFIRTDIPTPVMVVEAETDIPRYAPARQADSAHFRSWEIAGTSHADLYMLGPASAGILGCVLPPNAGPHHFIVHTALRDLRTWMRSPWKLPPTSPRIQLDASGNVARDVFGNALGGIRTPELDVPAATLSGFGNSPGLCTLFGTTTPFTPARLAGIYGDRTTYLTFFLQLEFAAFASKFVLEDDAWEMLADAVNVTF